LFPSNHDGEAGVKLPGARTTSPNLDPFAGELVYSFESLSMCAFISSKRDLGTKIRRFSRHT
jgi:hypothetical protein